MHAHPVGLVSRCENRLESRNNRRIELTLHRLRKTQTRYSTRKRVAVRPIGRHRVVGIGDRNDPRQQRNLVSAQSVRIAMAVDSLVVMADDVGDLLVIVDLAQDLLADLRVLLHLPPLLERQRPRLLEQPCGQPDLADVVDEPTKMRQSLLLLAETHARSDVARVDRDGG